MHFVKCNCNIPKQNFKYARPRDKDYPRSVPTRTPDVCAKTSSTEYSGGKQLLVWLNKNSKQQILFRNIFGETTTNEREQTLVVFVYFEYYFVLVYFPASSGASFYVRGKTVEGANPSFADNLQISLS